MAGANEVSDTRAVASEHIHENYFWKP